MNSDLTSRLTPRFRPGSDLDHKGKWLKSELEEIRFCVKSDLSHFSLQSERSLSFYSLSNLNPTACLFYSLPARLSPSYCHQQRMLLTVIITETPVPFTGPVWLHVLTNKHRSLLEAWSDFYRSVGV